MSVLTGHTGRVQSIAFSADGRRLVTGATSGIAKIWDATTGVEILTLEGFRSTILGAAFRPDGQQVAATSYGQIYLFPHGLDALKEAVAPRARRDLTSAECLRFLRSEDCS